MLPPCSKGSAERLWASAAADTPLFILTLLAVCWMPWSDDTQRLDVPHIVLDRNLRIVQIDG
ncbi:MAG: hypothetical protein Q7J82_07010, partial [Coriobacteriia bacterium]|nr:hypothetical protein [Coriobacteriia bacterium]